MKQKYSTHEGWNQSRGFGREFWLQVFSSVNIIDPKVRNCISSQTRHSMDTKMKYPAMESVQGFESIFSTDFFCVDKSHPEAMNGILSETRNGITPWTRMKTPWYDGICSRIRTIFSLLIHFCLDIIHLEAMNGILSETRNGKLPWTRNGITLWI